MDVAQLGYEIDSSDALTAERNLNRMTGAAGTAERQATSLERRMLALGASIGAAFSLTQAINSARQLDRAIGELSTLLPGATEDLRKMEQAARRMGREFGTGTRVQVQTFYSAVSGGATDAEAAIARVDAANRLAVGGVADFGASVRILNAATNAYAASGLTAADAADTLFTGVRFGETTVTELATTLGRAIPIASALDVEFSELVGAVAALTTQGQDTALAVTGIRAALNATLAPSQQASELAQQLGIDFSAAGVEALGFAGFMELVAERTNGSQEQLTTLFGSIEAGTAVLALAGQGGVKLAEIMEAMEDRSGAANQAFEDIREELSFGWNVIAATAASKAEDLGYAFLSVLVPAGLAVVDVLEGAEGASVALDFALRALALTAGVLVVQRIGAMTASLWGSIAAYLATIPAVRAYVAAVALVGPVSATATAATTAFGVAIRFMLGPVGLLITAVGAAAAAWAAYDRSQGEVRWATEELNELLAEEARLKEENAEATREGAEESLANAMAKREEATAIAAAHQAQLAALRDQFRERAGFGSPTSAAIRDNVSIRMLAVSEQLARVEEFREENMAKIARLQELITGFAAEEREEREAAAAARQTDFERVIENLDAEFYAMSINRRYREANFAVLQLERKLRDELSEAEEQEFRRALERNTQRERMIETYDRVRGAVVDYREEIHALNRLMITGAITAGEYWDAVLNNQLVSEARDFDAYLRAQGAQIGMNSVDQRLANEPGNPFGNMATNPALALYGEDINRLQEQFFQRQQILDQMREADIISFEQYQRRLTELQQAGAAERVDLERQAYATQLAAASSAFDSIAQATAAFAGEQSGVYQAMFAISKAFAIAESIINIQRAMANALALPFPANIPAMAVVAAEGASIVAAIEAVANTGFRTGGYTGNGPVNQIAGVVHGQEGVLNAAAMRGIGRDNLDYMNRHGRMPANDRGGNDNGKTVIVADMRGALITREAFEDLKRLAVSTNAKVDELDANFEGRVEAADQALYEKGG